MAANWGNLLEKLREISDGRFFSGEKAQEYGLVDDIGNFFDAVQIAAGLSGIKGDPQLEFPRKKWNNYLDLVLESATSALARFYHKPELSAPPSMR